MWWGFELGIQGCCCDCGSNESNKVLVRIKMKQVREAQFARSALEVALSEEAHATDLECSQPKPGRIWSVIPFMRSRATDEASCTTMRQSTEGERRGRP